MRAWRRLVDAGPSLIACSGGADSTALTLALAASVGERIRVGHVVHDMRSDEEALADRDAVRSLAAALGLGFSERSVRVPAGNAEAGARAARLCALAEMAKEFGCATVATAHHAGDQFETVLMALARGAGPGGLAGMARSRPIGAAGVRLIRPMLGIERADAERVCRLAGVVWREDATNEDRSRLRSALRHEVIPPLRAHRPGAVRRAAASAELLADAAGLVEDRAREVFGGGLSWPRETLAAQRRIVVGAGLRGAWAGLTGGEGADRLSRAIVDAAIDAIADGRSDRRVFHWPGCVRIDVAGGLVTIRRVDPTSMEGRL